MIFRPIIQLFPGFLAELEPPTDFQKSTFFLKIKLLRASVKISVISTWKKLDLQLYKPSNGWLTTLTKELKGQQATKKVTFPLDIFPKFLQNAQENQPWQEHHL